MLPYLLSSLTHPTLSLFLYLSVSCPSHFVIHPKLITLLHLLSTHPFLKYPGFLLPLSSYLFIPFSIPRSSNPFPPPFAYLCSHPSHTSSPFSFLPSLLYPYLYLPRTSFSPPPNPTTLFLPLSSFSFTLNTSSQTSQPSPPPISSQISPPFFLPLALNYTF